MRMFLKCLRKGLWVREGGEQGSVYGIDLCTNIVLRSSPNARTESGSKMRCLPPTPVAYTRKEARAEWGEQEFDYITVERGGDKLKGCQERGSDGRHFYNFNSGQTSRILGDQVCAAPWAFG